MGKRIDGQAVHAFIVLAASSVLLCGCSAFLRPQEKHADAQLLPTVGNQTRGLVTFIERSDGVQVTYNLSGMPPDSDHALQVHERGDCNAADGSSAGPVFSPAAERLKAGARVEGDLGNIHADSNGVATGFIVAPDGRSTVFARYCSARFCCITMRPILTRIRSTVRAPRLHAV